MKKTAGALLSSIQIDRGSHKKISVQLYMALRDIILSGGLASGARLPASRTLAKETNVSRTTVIDALDRLIAEGLLVSRVGAGTFVSDVLVLQKPVPGTDAQGPDPAPPPRLSHAITHAKDIYSPRAWLPHTTGAFVTALPALDAFPMSHWARLSARHMRENRDLNMGYGEPKGLFALRNAIANHLNASRGIKCQPEQIYITAGAQQAFSLIGKVLLNAGDRVWYENPGAAGARNAFLANGAQLVPVNVDQEGLNVADGLAKAPHFRLAFVTPSHQQPLGRVMSLARRLELLEAANTAQAMIVEDDYDGDFHFGHQPQPNLKSIDTHGRVIYVGTFSKSLFPSLRLGFFLAPDSLVGIFDQVFSSWASTAPTFIQATVSDFMDEGHFSTHIRMMRRLYKARYNVLMQAGKSLPHTLVLQPASSGFHTTALLDLRIDERKIVLEAKENNVTVTPLSRYSSAPIPQKGLVLGFGNSTPEDIQMGVRTLCNLASLNV